MYWKITSYLFMYKKDEKAVIYCSANGSTIILTKEEAELIEWLQGKNIGEDELPEDMFSILEANGILVPAQKDEAAEILSSHQKVVDNSNLLHLTLFITDECNFNCFYCFVDKKQKNYMDVSNFGKVKKYIEKHIESYKGLSISWFGGEPLERSEELIQYSSELVELCKQKGITYQSTLVTNGYDLTKDTFLRLHEAGVGSFQITFDGFRKYHNEVRVHEKKGQTFDSILNNLIAIKSCDCENFHIRVRCNQHSSIDNEIEKFVEMYQELFFGDRRFYLQVRTIVDYDSDDAGELLGTYINKIPSLCELALKYKCSEGYLTDKFYPKRIWCSTLSRHAIVVSPECKVYTCDSTVNNQQFCYAMIDENGDLIDNPDFDKSYFQEEQDEKCLRCKRMPLCFGSCQRIYHKLKKHACGISDKDVQAFLEYLLETRT